jgi:HSP20 family protein
MQHPSPHPARAKSKGEAFMALTRWRPNQTLTLRDAFQQLFEEALRDGNADPDAITSGVFPVDIHETQDAIEIDASIPGADAADIEVSATENTVMIKAEVREHREQREGQALRRERVTGVFQRAFTLPTEVDPNGVQAKFENGVLCVTLPKSEAQKPRRIEVRGQSDGKANGKSNGQQQRVGQGQQTTTQPTSSQAEAQRAQQSSGQQTSGQQGGAQQSDQQKTDAQKAGSGSR